MALNDNKFRGYGEQGFTGTINDRERAFLLANPRGTLQEYYNALGAAGFTGTINDREAAYFAAEPFVPLGAGGSDTHWVNVVFLSGFEGVPAETTIIDESSAARVVTNVSGVVTDDTQFKYGATSAYFAGVPDYLHAPDGEDLTIGSGDFTVETFMRFASTPSGSHAFLSHWNSNINQRGWMFTYNSGVLNLYYSTTGTDVNNATIAWAPSANIWYHVAASRVGSNLRLFVDGVLLVTHDIGSSAIHNSTSTLKVGATENPTVTWYLNGWVDESRITIGVGRYTGAFTPPASAFPRA